MMVGMTCSFRWVRWMLVGWFASCTMALGQAAGQVQVSPRETTTQLIGVQAELAQLKELTARNGGGDAADLNARWEMLWLHQRISEKVMGASLEVDATMAQIDNEIARANEVRSLLSDKRDHTVSRANLLGAIVGGAVGATSSGLQFSQSLTKPAAGVGIAAGTLSAGFAVAGIHAQNGKSARFEFESNMLAEIFDRPTLPNSRYPATVWTFLNEQVPSGPAGLTRRDDLMRTWVLVRRVDSLESRDKIGRLTSEPAEELKLSIDDFEDRAAMLQDVRARISYFKRDLGELLGSLPATEE